MQKIKLALIASTLIAMNNSYAVTFIGHGKVLDHHQTIVGGTGKTIDLPYAPIQKKK